MINSIIIYIISQPFPSLNLIHILIFLLESVLIYFNCLDCLDWLTFASMPQDFHIFKDLWAFPYLLSLGIFIQIF